MPGTLKLNAVASIYYNSHKPYNWFRSFTYVTGTGISNSSIAAAAAHTRYSLYIPPYGDSPSRWKFLGRLGHGYADFAVRSISTTQMGPTPDHREEDLRREKPSLPTPSKSEKLLTLPTILTIGRVAAVPLLVTSVYAPNDRAEREETWWELGAARGLFTGPWVLCGDFNTLRYPSEKYNCSRINRAMTELSEFIEDMELMDLDLAGGEFTWRRGDRHSTAARLDRFLISEEWDSNFRNIKQSVLQRIVSDHSPLMLQCGEWGTTKSYFKFENWWLTTDGFNDRVKTWWESSQFHGKPDFVLVAKLRALKAELKEWSKTSQVKAI